MLSLGGLKEEEEEEHEKGWGNYLGIRSKP
jgi:hypothetical protein